MRTPVSFLADRQGAKDLQEITGKTDVREDKPRNSAKSVLSENLTALIIGPLCASFVLALNHMNPGMISIIPGCPFLDAVIIGAVVCVLIIMCHRIKARHIKEIKDIQQNLTNPESEPGDETHP